MATLNNRERVLHLPDKPAVALDDIAFDSASDNEHLQRALEGAWAYSLPEHARTAVAFADPLGAVNRLSLPIVDNVNQRCSSPQKHSSPTSTCRTLP